MQFKKNKNKPSKISGNVEDEIRHSLNNDMKWIPIFFVCLLSLSPPHPPNQDTQDLIAWCRPIDVFGAISSKAGIHGEPGMWFHPGSPGKGSTLIVGQNSTAVEAFPISQINVICSYAVFEPDFKLVVTLSLTCGTYDPAENH